MEALALLTPNNTLFSSFNYLEWLPFLCRRTVYKRGANIEEVYDPIRKSWYKATPEELVRQSVIKSLVLQYHIPESLIIVEKELASLPYLNPAITIPKRRIDILCLKNVQIASGNFDLIPWIMIECKAVPINQKAIRQLVGYNSYLGAQVLGIVNQDSSFFITEVAPSSHCVENCYYY